MKITVILSLILTLFLAGCAQEAGKSTEDHAEPITIEATHAGDKDHHEHQEEAGLSLNDGEKWIVNPEMMVHVLSGENAIHAFETAAEKDHSKLAGELKENIDLLISSCTMTGESHEQLHVWLMPYIAQVDEMTAAENEAQSAEIFAKIQKSFETFSTFFQ